MEKPEHIDQLAAQRVSIKRAQGSIRARESEDTEGLRLLLIALAGAVLYHGGLLPFTHGNTYDAYIHMFFADSYHRSWFDVWDPRWYTGFSTTSYPPGTHMVIAGLMHLVPVRAAYVLVQLLGLLLLTVGVYRFSLLWVTARPAGYAAIALVMASSVSETIHLFGQLPTIFSLGVFLNGMPYIYRWLVLGKWESFFAAVIFSAATTAAHHVTTIFGSVFFVLPLGLHALRSVIELHPDGGPGIRVLMPPLLRGIFLAMCMILAMGITVYAYWIWSVNDPITQVPIPHGSREDFIARPDLGFVFFLLPWGTSILFLPYVFYLTITTRLWTLGLSVIICTILGTGGTTPISRAILGGAFEILTLDRFTFWATILILPFLGYMIDGLISGRSGQAIVATFGRGIQRILVGAYFVAMTLFSVAAAVLPTVQPTQPRQIDPTPIVQFLAEDNHDRWRYLTLGFGDQFAYISSQSSAQSVDGNYHSARRLPDLTRFSVERLENSKYLGVPGLGSLKQFLVNADKYHLKFVFSNDEFYDPLLFFAGWNRLSRMPNGVAVWEKPDVSPLPSIQPRRHTPALHATMWGLLPPIALALAGVVFLFGLLSKNFGNGVRENRPLTARNAGYSNPRKIKNAVVGLGILTLGIGTILTHQLLDFAQKPADPDRVVRAYFDDLDFRRFESAYQKLDPNTRPDYPSVLFNWRWRGGLLASYGKLAEIDVIRQNTTPSIIDWTVRLGWLTSLDQSDEFVSVRTIKRDGEWFLTPETLRPIQTPMRLQRKGDTSFNVIGRRQPRPETDLHRDKLDRPKLDVWGIRLVKRAERYFIIGGYTNADIDPAYVTTFGELHSDQELLVRQAGGEVMGQRLLPFENSGFRVDFEGVLSLTDAEKIKEYDPDLFVPPIFSAQPNTASAEVRALATGRDLYRGVGINNIEFSATAQGPNISGLAVNLGTETASIVRIVILLFDGEKRPIWTHVGYVKTNIFPGQSAPFEFSFPNRTEIFVMGDVGPDNLLVNGANPRQHHGNVSIPLIPMSPETGFGFAQIHVSAMTYDPEF